MYVSTEGSRHVLPMEQLSPLVSLVYVYMDTLAKLSKKSSVFIFLFHNCVGVGDIQFSLADALCRRIVGDRQTMATPPLVVIVSTAHILWAS